MPRGPSSLAATRLPLNKVKRQPGVGLTQYFWLGSTLTPGPIDELRVTLIM